MLDPQDLPSPDITVTISDVKADLRLHAMQGREALGSLFEYHLDLVNWHESDITRDLVQPVGHLGPRQLLGKDLTVAIPLAGQKSRYIHGLVTQAAYRESIDHHTAYVVTIRPRLWLLTLSETCRVFQNKTVPEVLREILQGHKLAAPHEVLTRTYRTWDTLTQYRESDFAFISRLLAHEGLTYYFRHGPKDHTLVLGDSDSAYQKHPEFDRIPIGKPKPISGSDQHLRTWQAGFSLQTEAVTLADFDFRLRGQSSRILERAGGSSEASDSPQDRERPPREIYDFPAGCVISEDQGEATGRADPGESRLEARHLARAQRDASGCQSARYEGTGTVRWLAPGMLFSVESDPQTFLATDIQLTLRNPAFLSGEATIDEACEIALQALQSTTPFRLPRMDKPRVLGPQTARVVGDKDEEISTDQYGRIRVHFHWDRERSCEEGSSCWVRVAQPWAGNRWGVFSIPRVGSEVVVEFLYGDPDRPLVTGSVYDGENQPPYELPKHKTRSGIKTRSSKGATPDNYNEIRFEDDKGKEELHLRAERNLTALVKHDQTVDVNGHRTVTIKKGDELHVKGSDKSVLVEGRYEIGVRKLFHLLVADGEECSAASPTCSLDLRQGAVTVEADKEIRLVCGKASLSLTQDGTITMDGTLLKLTGSEKIEANGKGATLDLTKTIAARGSQVTVTGENEVHLKGPGSQLDLVEKKATLSSDVTTIKGDHAVLLN